MSAWRITQQGINGFNDALKSPLLIAICIFGIVVVVAMLAKSQYIITKDNLIVQFGIIKSKFPVANFTSVLLDTDSKKLTVYMGEEFFVVTTNPEWNNDFVQALREVKPEIEFSFTLTDGKPDKK